MTEMVQYVIRRLLLLPLILFLVSAILFAFVVQVPVEARVMIYIPSTSPSISDEEFARLRQITIERYGLDKPFHVQYVRWVSNLLRGDWGYSPVWKQPVLAGLLQRAPATIELGLFALVPATLLALLFGQLAIQYKNRLGDYCIRGATFLGWAFPPFILGLFLVNILYARLHWFPPGRLSIWASALANSSDFRTFTGMYTIDALINGNLELFKDAVRHLVLPGLTLALTQWSLLTRVFRSSLLDTLSMDYIVTARAKGVSESEIVNVHATRNALLPVISIAGVATSMFLSNLMVIETLFEFNGVGRWAVKSALSWDIPVVLAFVLFLCFVVVIFSLTADILYAILDARIRLS